MFFLVVDLARWSSAFLHVSLLYALICVVHLALPARLVRGYVRDVYRLNGLRVFGLVIGVFALLLQQGWLDVQHLAALRVEHGVCACLLGLLGTLLFVLPYEQRTSSFWLDVYLGRVKNPQCFAQRADVKILLYLIGAIGLEVNLLIFYFEQRTGTNVSLYVSFFSFFLLEYFYHEDVHLYTFDFLVEYVGFKLVWGCLLFYPFFYPLGIWCAVRPRSLTFVRFGSSVISFFLGWILSRGANNQKYLFRTQPKAKFLGWIAPVTINERLLCSGWWSLSRHINYLGDILMAVGLTLAIDAGWTPWLYPAYYIVLFIARERTDFERCRERYGRDWDEYCRRVPYRIVPFLY